MEGFAENAAWKSRGQGARDGVMRIMVFLAMFAACASVLHAVISAGLRRIPTAEFGVMNRIVAGGIDAEILISGSSRALSHYDPRILAERTRRSTFNIGLNGSQTDMQLARLRTYLRYNKPPALLIHNLDIFSFQVTHGGVYDPGQYMPFLGEPAIYNALKRIDRGVWKSRVIPLYGYAVEDLRFTWLLGVRGALGWYPREDHFLGYRPRDAVWTEDFDMFKAANPSGITFQIDQKGVDAMDELMQLCRDRGVRVLLVYSPEYVEMQGLTANRDGVFSRFRGLADRYSAVMWDYSASDISVRKEYFFNSQHLNVRGAEVFSSDLASRLALHTELLQGSRAAAERD